MPARNMVVKSLRQSATRGVLLCGHLRLPCALGKGGIRALKREGDGATPAGKHRVRLAFFRDGQTPGPRPQARLPLRRISPDLGWCDATNDRNYNREVRHPYPVSAERLWRADGLYDVVVVVAYNERPRIKGLGSAIFMHIARDGFTPTEGCVALRRKDLLKLLPLIGRKTRLIVGR